MCGHVVVEPCALSEINEALHEHHYLGPLKSGGRLVLRCTVDGQVVGYQLWKHPTSRHLPQDGTWLELSRWCLWGVKNAGSMMHGAVVRWLRSNSPQVTTLVSYSDPSQGHTGALYRSCNWKWQPTWQRLRPPPTGNGSWGGKGKQSVKDRWVFELGRDARREHIVSVKDKAAEKLLAA